MSYDFIALFATALCCYLSVLQALHLTPLFALEIQQAH